MQLSAEVRLWWQDEDREAVELWFEQLTEVTAGGAPKFEGANPPEPRRDDYLLDLSHAELGIKVRNAKTEDKLVEVKSLVTQRGVAAPFGPVTIWTKSSSAELKLDNFPIFSTNKWRRLRKFAWSNEALEEIPLGENEKPLNGAKPDAGCNLEFTRVAVVSSENVWWTLGYEAFGLLDEVERILHACLLKSISRKSLPALDKARFASYPEWIMQVARSRSASA